jgi:hypothetical protein
MKKTLLMLAPCLILLSCAQEPRYTMDSPEIDAVKALFDLYVKGDYEGQRPYYAESAQIFQNTTESNPSTVDAMIALQKEESGFFQMSPLR